MKCPNGHKVTAEMNRCPQCHLAIIPDEVRAIWKRKFGTDEKPHYQAICKICGKPAGEHYGTECEPPKET